MPTSTEPTFDLTRLDGWFSLPVGEWNTAVIPLGVLGYLVFVPLFWAVGRRGRVGLIVSSSLLLSWATLGAAFTGLLALAVVLGWLVVIWTASTVSTADRSEGLPSSAPPARSIQIGCAILVLLYIPFLFYPQPGWLPPRNPPLYFYLQWAGLAFVVLKTISVLIDLGHETIICPQAGGGPHRLDGSSAAVLSPGRFTAFLLFAPTLRMGPIYRYPDFAKDLESPSVGVARHDIATGIGRILFGLIRIGAIPLLTKEISAENLYTAPQDLHTYQIVLGLILQPVSIYLWIAGYCDIAIGIGRLCGFRVPENFRAPLLARNIADFWRRWNITLGLWIRDYLYIPLGGNRRHVELNYLLAFLFIGLWHGLYPSYIVWGISQGAGLAIHRRWRLFWQSQREHDTTLYRRCRSLGFCDGRIGRFLGWLVTLVYQLLTIAVFMDERHAGSVVGRELMSRVL